ncbi:DNA polymerase III subunit gamma and tau [Intrasporangium sp.]|uniref:DNA polymerase III subunit gamma and tau n=1 Tax=Intrasporangium sp. TaxID=1925024 RepID=UPI0032214703
MATALYRRYRPESFADVIGQEHVTGPLMQALRTGRVGHAYLFSGPRGCGKTTSARILARCLNCAQGPTPTPCGTCESCVALARGGPGSVDVIEIDAASHGGVDDARDLRERASYGPALSRYKVYIIDEAHMVTPQGFNALLKIVEEPPEHVKFVFATTEPEKVIGTIRSRTHHYPFRLVPPAKLAAYLTGILEQEGVAAEPGVLSFVCRAGGGSVRDSLSVLDQLIAGSGPEGLTYAGTVALLGFTDAELLDATIDALAAGDAAATFRQVDKVIESGHDPRRFVEDVLERLRDLIIVAAVQDGAGQVLRGVTEDQLDRMRVQQAAFGPAALSRAADIANAGLTEMTGATSPRLQLELICARILLPGASGPQGYAARLDRIERRLEVGGAVPSLESPGGQAPGAAPPGPSEVHVAAPTAAPPRPSAPQPARAPSAARPGPGPASPQPPVAAAPGPSPAAVAGTGLDTDAIRRAWADVLGRVFRMRRITWTFVSQNAQVVGYDGHTLTLGIATEGLTNTFRVGNHAEIVRQALIDELGLDVQVEGVYVPPGATTDQGPPSASRTEPPGGPGGSGGSASGSAASTGDAAAAPRPPAPRPGSATSPSRGGHRSGDVRDNGPTAGTGPASPVSRSLEDNAGWGSVTAPPPDWAAPTAAGSAGPRSNGNPTAAAAEPGPVSVPGPVGPPAVGRVPGPVSAPGPAETPTAASARGPVHPSDPAGPGRAASRPARPGADTVRASLDAARRSRTPERSDRASGAAPVVGAGTGPTGVHPDFGGTDDSAVSGDDEDIEVSTDVGRAVVEKVLGGRVLQEFQE